MIEAPVSSRDRLQAGRRRRVRHQAQLTLRGGGEGLLHRRERGVGDLTDELLVLAARKQVREPAVGVDMGQQNALAEVGEPVRQRQRVARALGAVDADDERSGLENHDATHAAVRRRPGVWGRRCIPTPPAPHRPPGWAR